MAKISISDHEEDTLSIFEGKVFVEFLGKTNNNTLKCNYS